MRMRMGAVAQILVLLVLLPFISVIFAIIPGGPTFLSDLFWETLGTFDIFEGAANALNATVGQQEAISTDAIMSTLLSIVLKAAFQAFILGLCVTVINEMTSKVIRPYGKSRIVSFLNGGPILTSFLGVVVGLLLCRLMFTASEVSQLGAVLSGVLTIALIVLGISIMLGMRSVSSLYSTARIWSLMLKVVIGAVFAACVTGAVTALLQVPLVIENGGNLLLAIAWYLIMIVFMLLMVLLYMLFGED